MTHPLPRSFADSEGRSEDLEVTSLKDLARLAGGDHRSIRVRPGTYRMSDYLTPEVLREIHEGLDPRSHRPPSAMLEIRGNGNFIDCSGVILEIETDLFGKMPPHGYTRCLTVSGRGNTLRGLTVRNSGANIGSGGNLLSLAGDETTLEWAFVQVRGSTPYGYGDLLGKGGPNLVPIRKQSGIQVLGSGCVLRHCRVSSRAFGHCFYTQSGKDILLEDCHAEGEMRQTLDMLGESTGIAHQMGFKSVYPNRDGHFVMTPGYTKSLVEDGFRTYGGAGHVTLIGCTAVHTRAGFEIGAPEGSPLKSLLEDCEARGCERAFLIGSHTVARRCRGDAAHGPLLYLRGGVGSDLQIELTGRGPESLVHALATIAGAHHRVHLFLHPDAYPMPALPIYLGFGMPDHGEMSSPIQPTQSHDVFLKNDIPSVPVLTSDLAVDVTIESQGRVEAVADRLLSPGPWGLPPDGVAK